MIFVRKTFSKHIRNRTENFDTLIECVYRILRYEVLILFWLCFKNKQICLNHLVCALQCKYCPSDWISYRKNFILKFRYPVKNLNRGSKFQSIE